MHTLCFAQFAVQLDTTYTHSWCTHCAWISRTAVHLYFSPVSVHSVTVLLHCTTVHSLVPAWPLLCQPITEELQFTCFTLIGPLSVPTSIPPKLQHVDTAILPCRTGFVKSSWCGQVGAPTNYLITPNPSWVDVKVRLWQLQSRCYILVIPKHVLPHFIQGLPSSTLFVDISYLNKCLSVTKPAKLCFVYLTEIKCVELPRNTNKRYFYRTIECRVARTR